MNTSVDLMCEEKLSIQILRFTAINYHLKSAGLKLTAFIRPFSISLGSLMSRVNTEYFLFSDISYSENN